VSIAQNKLLPRMCSAVNSRPQATDYFNVAAQWLTDGHLMGHGHRGYQQ
jgi:hypothetical protein